MTIKIVMWEDCRKHTLVAIGRRNYIDVALSLYSDIWHNGWRVEVRYVNKETGCCGQETDFKL